MRQGPKTGYSFAAKIGYREEVWAALEKGLEKPKKNCVCLILPSSEGAEIPLLLGKGYSEENIIAVDKNAALIATARWRKKYKKIKIYGNEFQRAIERIQEDGIVIDIANLDFCSNISTSLIRQLVSCSTASCWADPCRIAITILKGREMEEIFSIYRDAIREDLKFNFSKPEMGFSEINFNPPRLMFAVSKATPNYPVKVIAASEYKSQTQVMSWVAFSSMTMSSIVRKFGVILDEINKETRLVDWAILYEFRGYIPESFTRKKISQMATEARGKAEEILLRKLRFLKGWKYGYGIPFDTLDHYLDNNQREIAITISRQSLKESRSAYPDSGWKGRIINLGHTKALDLI